MRLMTRRTLSISASTAILLCGVGCSEPKRPSGVPLAATRVEGAKTGYWQVCHVDQRVEIHCTVWNDGGTVLKDETYLPLEEGPTPQERELQIRAREICRGGPYLVCLTNGRVLLPQSQFEQLKAFLKK